MALLMTTYVQGGYSDSEEFARVDAIARSLLDHLNTPDALAKLSEANLPGQSSSFVQTSFAPFAWDQGFIDESKGLFSSYENRAVRPDYFRKLGDTGILLEVERGKTTINNMDFLDFWK